MLLACRIIGAVALSALAAATLTPLPEWLASHYAERPRLELADAIVVLGSGLLNDSLGDPSLQRVIHGIRLQRRGLAPLLVVTGETPPAGPSEPEIRARLARDLGVPPAAIMTVGGVHTTHEEAIAADAALRPRGVRSVLLVSSSIHLVRARLGLSRPGLGAATRATLEAVGLGVLFLVANLALAALAVALARAGTGGFVPVYAIDDLALLAVSLLQGFFFRWWQDRG